MGREEPTALPLPLPSRPRTWKNFLMPFFLLFFSPFRGFDCKSFCLPAPGNSPSCRWCLAGEGELQRFQPVPGERPGMSWAGLGGRNSCLYSMDLTSRASQNVAGSIQAPNLHEFPLQTRHRSIFITQTAGPAPLNERFSHPSLKALLKLKKTPPNNTKQRQKKPKTSQSLVMVVSIWKCLRSRWCGWRANENKMKIK